MSDPKPVKDFVASDITMVKNAIHNPADPRHYARVKPVERLISITYKGQILAQTTNGLRVLEVGHDLYDPALYLPVDAIKVKLVINQKTSHCPLKGDAQYFNLIDQDNNIIEENIAWSYPEPFGFIDAIKGKISFYTDRVTMEEAPL
ncbi:MAG: DUF427 domain-containing protein [Rhizobiales bacterium]|nr:DUF427 domain-containing protein [Hyphomicrobiales bacterium]NRB13179.1 DUF427 domain-containing protein [Hyphomicrobiales bacterium]